MDWYLSSDPLTLAIWGCAGIALLCWLLSVITREYSWVDRIWSVTPALYAIHFAAHARFDDTRLNVMAALITLWGARLTFNYARKGGYAPGGEDYRWGVIRQAIGPVAFQAFNATFISPLQNALLLAITLPMYGILVGPPVPMGPLDWALAAAFVAFLAGETVADQQQWTFHVRKKQAKERGEDVPRGFLDRGLWAHSRHPNFFCELSQWWCIYGFSVAAGLGPLNWTIAGAAVLTALFHGSTGLTEKLSAQKYPEYAEYQKSTSRIIPRFSTKN